MYILDGDGDTCMCNVLGALVCHLFFSEKQRCKVLKFFFRIQHLNRNTKFKTFSLFYYSLPCLKKKNPKILIEIPKN